MESNHPAVIALLHELGAAWPGALTFDEIQRRWPGSGIALDSDGVTLLMRLVVTKMIELRTWRALVAVTISSRLRASANARQEACSKGFATTLLHAKTPLDDPAIRSFLKLLDGTRDRDGLLEAMKAEFPAMAEGELKAGIEPGLEKLCRAGILES